MSLPTADPTGAVTELTEVERHLLQSLQQIRFGSVEVTIHDSRIVQIEKSEKLRFDPRGKPIADSLS